MYSIVIADDQKFICDSTRAYIQNEFPNLYFQGSFYNGKDLFMSLKAKMPDIIISDIMMPGLSGLEICKYVRQNSQNTQIILISGYQEFEFARAAIEYNVLEYLVKPYSSKKLISAIKTAIEKLDNLDEKEKQNSTHTKTLHGDIKEFIELNYAYPDLSTSYIATQFKLSGNYVNDVFRKFNGTSITDYINEFRIKKACEMLDGSFRLNLDELAISLGYNSQSYFGKVFKARMGVTPSEYKRGLNHNE